MLATAAYRCGATAAAASSAARGRATASERPPAAATAARPLARALGAPLPEGRNAAGVASLRASPAAARGVAAASRPAARPDAEPWGPPSGSASGAAASAAAAASALPARLPDHKIFDEAVITVRGGDGGSGEVVTQNKKPKEVRNFAYRHGGSQPKTVWLQPKSAALGGDGGDVILYVDPNCDTLLHLHNLPAGATFAAKKGSAADSAASSALAGRRAGQPQRPPAPLRIPVPPGTVVRAKRTHTLLGDLLQPGEELLVARGGRGGSGVDLSKIGRPGAKGGTKGGAKGGGADGREGSKRRASLRDDEAWEVEETLSPRAPAALAAAAAGTTGEEKVLELLLRVVADVGLVGLPNAGKSSLLAGITRAKPEVADYPFTTLMPNLGVLARDGLLAGAARAAWDGDAEGGFGGAAGAGGGEAPPAVVADLPGLIEGAHAGRGLGRAFLRHLRRTRIFLHVLDAALPDPLHDYEVLRKELWLYNPEYAVRPHIVVLNKTDLPAAKEAVEGLRRGLAARGGGGQCPHRGRNAGAAGGAAAAAQPAQVE